MLPRVGRARVVDQAQIAAHLAQLEQRLEDDDLAAGHALAGDLVADFLVHGQAHGFVQVALGFVELDPVDDLGFRRQFGGHLFLGPAQQERFDPTVEVLQSYFAGALFNRDAVIAVEAFHVAEPAGQQEMKQRPQLAQVVFQWRAAQAQALARVQLARRPGRPCCSGS